MPTLNVGANVTIALSVRTNTSVDFTNSSASAVNLTFDTAPFTDGSLSLSVPANSAPVSKTTVNTVKKVTVGGDRTGEIDIIAILP